jgi:DNA-binding CsgD family transcriptional regulator
MDQASSRAVGELFLQAALDANRWQEPLHALARATGSLRAQLLGVTTTGELAFNSMTHPDAGLESDFAKLPGAHDPSVNYRIAASHGRATGQVVHEADYTLARARTGSTAYEEACEKHGLPFGCQAALTRTSGTLVGLALLRSRSDGLTTAADRAFFEAVIPQAQASVRLQSAIEGQGAELVRGALDAVAATALLVDGFGRIVSATAEAERLLAGTNRLNLRSCMLIASTTGQTSEIQAAIRDVLRGTALEMAVLLHGGGKPPIQLQIKALPRREWCLGFQPRAVIILRGGGARDLGQALRAEFGLTVAEAQVAVRLASGISRRQIAEERATSIGTVRQQVKTIFAKLDVRREAEFMMLLAPFIALEPDPYTTW